MSSSTAEGARRATTRLGVAVVLAGAAAGSVAYVVVVTVLARWPAVVRARGSGGAARPMIVGAVALAAAIGATVSWTAARRDGPPPERRVLGALAAVSFGAAWVAWGLLEQHALRTFDVAPSSADAASWDALFHGVGVLTAGLGTSVLSVRGQRDRVT